MAVHSSLHHRLRFLYWLALGTCDTYSDSCQQHQKTISIILSSLNRSLRMKLLRPQPRTWVLFDDNNVENMIRRSFLIAGMDDRNSTHTMKFSPRNSRFFASTYLSFGSRTITSTIVKLLIVGAKNALFATELGTNKFTA